MCYPGFCFKPHAPMVGGNSNGYSSTYLAMGFANVLAGTWYKRVLEYSSRYGIR